MVRLFERAKSKARNLYRETARESSQVTSSITPPAPPQPAISSTTQLRPDALLVLDTETLPLHRLQERIWGQAYDELTEKEPGIVQAFENIVSAELEQCGTGLKASDRTESESITPREVRSRQMRQLVEKGLDRTAKGAAVKQGIDDSLQAVHAIRGTMDRAVQAAPEAAVVWATVCLGLEILSNPVTEALENRKGIQYVLSRMEWYWKLVDLLLDDNKGETSTAALRDELEKNIIRLFEKLLLYQMSSTCLYHRSEAAVIARDVLRLDDWVGQLDSVKAAEEAVQHDMEQYNTQQANIRLQKLNVTAAAIETNLQSIFAALQDQKQDQTKREEEDKDKECLRDIRVTDPRTDKQEIEEKKGGLLQESYTWICEHADFQRFRNDGSSRVLWIKGDPGKGKTMLLCGIINELERDSSVSSSYFFCQAAGGDRYNTATSVLRGLIFDLARKTRHLIKYVREKYDYSGGEIFSSVGAWQDLSEMFSSMLQDPSLANAILVIDALDECSVDRERLLGFISKPSPVKWVVSSRNWFDIEESLGGSEHMVKLHLELHPGSISQAVDSYIKYKMNELARKKSYDEQMKDTVLQYLTENANGTFLWVALVCHELAKSSTRRRHTSDTLRSFPSGLIPLYERMLSGISRSEDASLCKEILATVSVAYRPTSLEELKALVTALGNLDKEECEEVISSCGSFLTLKDGFVSFVHQSAKDYLLEAGSATIIPLGVAHQHCKVFSRSLEILSATLHRDMYHLKDPGYSIDQVSAPEDDPLTAIHYPCIFWARHLSDWVSQADVRDDMIDSTGSILDFFRKKSLYWLEALSLLRSISSGVKAIETLECLLKETSLDSLRDIVHDARRFILAHKVVVEIAPLQTYASGLVFSPTNSLIRQSFHLEEPDWIISKPRVEEDWTACLQSFEGQSDGVMSVAFSNDSQRLASGSRDKTINIWDATSAACIKTLRGHERTVKSVAFSKDGRWLVSASGDRTVKVWDATSASSMCLQTLQGHGEAVLSANFSNNGQRIVSASRDTTIKIWDWAAGTCLQTLEGHEDYVNSAVFSNDDQRVASGSEDSIIKIWDATSASGVCTHTLEGHTRLVRSVVFSGDGQRLASGSMDQTVKIWDATSGVCIQTLEGHSSIVTSVIFSSDGQRLASGSGDRTVKIWDMTSSGCSLTLEGHNSQVNSVAFSHDGRRLASGCADSIVKIWDTTTRNGVPTREGHGSRLLRLVLSKDDRLLACIPFDATLQIWDATSGVYIQTLRGHHRQVISAVFSDDGQRLASGSWDKTVRVWDSTTGICLHTLEGHTGAVMSVAFSYDGRLASGSSDETVKIWNATSSSCIQTVYGHERGVSSLAFSNNGQRVASASGSFKVRHNVIKIWDATSGICSQTLEGHDKAITATVFSNDDRCLVSASRDRTLKIWDVNSGVCVQTLSIDCAITEQLSFDPRDDCRLLTKHGAVHLDYLKTPITAPPADQTFILYPKFSGYGISTDYEWIMHDDRRVLWLPPGNRPQMTSRVAGSKIVLGCGLRRVLVIELGRIGQSGICNTLRDGT